MKKRPPTKTCACGLSFERGERTDREWDAVKRCPACRREQLRLRLVAKVIVDANGCWIWQGSKRNGYGRLTVDDRRVDAHRLSYELHVGPLGRMEACHRCDVPACINPVHLFAGTHQDNVDDAVAKGRAPTPPLHRGEAHPGVTLTDAQVAEIRRLCASGMKQRDIAAQFGCTQSTVWRYAHGRSRQEVSS